MQMIETTTEGLAIRATPRMSNRGTVMLLFGLLAAAAPFIAILCFGVPSWFPSAVTLDTVTIVRSGAHWRDPSWSLAGRLTWSLLLATGVVSLMNLRGWWGKWLPLAVLLAGLAIPQACIWAGAQSKDMLIGGLVPFTDASGYLDYACQMIGNHRIAYGFTDRPMFSALLSSLIESTGMKLQPALAAFLAFCGAGMFLSVREMHARFGAVTSICFLFVIYTFYGRFIGQLMTEHLGLGLSLYALPLLLRGVMERQRGAWFAGMLFLSAALFARAGAYFVLPMLCLVAGRRFRNAGRFSFRMAGLAFAVVLVSFALNRLLLVRLFDPASRPQSNFSYVAYGTLRGTDWTEALKTYGTDHKKIRAAIFEHLREKPFSVLHAVRRTWREFFWDARGFGFMGREWSPLLLYAFLLALVLGVFRASRSPYDAFSVAVALGILASIPWVPPADCDSMRVYAATMPLQACLAAGAIGALVKLVAPAFRKNRPALVPLVNTVNVPAADSWFGVACGGLMLFLTVAVPLGRAVLSSEKHEFSPIGGIGDTADEIRQYQLSPPGISGVSRGPSTEFTKAFAIHLMPDDAGPTRLPNVRISDFRARLGGFDGFAPKKEGAWLAALPPGVSLLNGLKQGILVLPTEKLLRTGVHVDFHYFNVGGLILSCDTALTLPDPDIVAVRP